MSANVSKRPNPERNTILTYVCTSNNKRTSQPGAAALLCLSTESTHQKYTDEAQTTTRSRQHGTKRNGNTKTRSRTHTQGERGRTKQSWQNSKQTRTSRHPPAPASQNISQEGTFYKVLCDRPHSKEYSGIHPSALPTLDTHANVSPDTNAKSYNM